MPTSKKKKVVRVDSTTSDDAPAERDWAAEIAAAESVELLDAIDKEGRALRIFTPDAEGTALHRALRDRRKEIEAQWAKAQSAWDAPAIAASVEVPEVAVSTTQVERRKPQDHLPPVNRAARRKAARKKGGRR